MDVQTVNCTIDEQHVLRDVKEYNLIIVLYDVIEYNLEKMYTAEWWFIARRAIICTIKCLQSII